MFVRRVFVHFDFFDDNLTFFSNFLIVKFAVKEHIKQHIYRQREMLCQCFDIIACVFFAGKCVELTAHFVDGLGNFLCGTTLCTFKHHVFNKMGNAPLCFCFIAGAYAHPNPHREKLYMIYGFGDNTNTVVQCCNFII